MQPTKTAVLFLVYNRLDTTSQVFEAIRGARPPRLYVAGDGPRKDRPDDNDNVRAVRDHVLRGMDWNGEVHTLFQEENLGCRRAVREALRWFFAQEEMGIVLEDDILPMPSFFRFCEDCLTRFQGNDQIGAIVGKNRMGNHPATGQSHFFATKFNCWGWASWRDRILDADFDMGYDDNVTPADFPYRPGFAETVYLLKIIQSLRQGKVDSWGWPLDLNFKKKGWLSLVSAKNYVRNLGFGAGSTHTSQRGRPAPEIFDDYDGRIDPIEIAPDDEYLQEVYLKKYRGACRLPRIWLSLKYPRFWSGLRRLCLRTPVP